jgi:predicted XRE-type DNA-binding protein
MKLSKTRSSGNVFRDLGFSRPEAEHLRVRAEMMVALERAIGRLRVTQAQAAKILGVSQPRVSALLGGRIDLFSADTLIDMLARLGIDVRIVLKRSRRPVRVA